MPNSNSRAKVVAKVLLAAVLIAAVIGGAGRSLAPSMPIATLFFWCTVIVGAFVLVTAIWAVLNLQLGQWILRRGGTDAAWFWFNSEPPGLTALREQQHSLDKQAKK